MQRRCLETRLGFVELLEGSARTITSRKSDESERTVATACLFADNRQVDPVEPSARYTRAINAIVPQSAMRGRVSSKRHHRRFTRNILMAVLHSRRRVLRLEIRYDVSVQSRGIVATSTPRSSALRVCVRARVCPCKLVPKIIPRSYALRSISRILRQRSLSCGLHARSPSSRAIVFIRFIRA